MNDREIAYEQNVTGLEIAWRERIERFACEAVAESMRLNPDEIEEYWRCQACELVSADLLNSERWQNVTAADISDIAYEAVNRELDKRDDPSGAPKLGATGWSE